MRSTARIGGEVLAVPLRPDFRHDLDLMLSTITAATKLVYISQPNNPTATANSDSEIADFLEAVPEHVLTIVDQAYFEYVEADDYGCAIDHLRRGHRVAVMRTFSKIYGLAGLRVGYMVAPEAVAAATARAQRAFEVSSLAQAAALASLTDQEEVGLRRHRNTANRAELIELLTEAGMEPEAGAVANFVFLKPPVDPLRFTEFLLDHGVAVRPLAGFGAPDHVRISVGNHEDHELLRQALYRFGGG